MWALVILAVLTLTLGVPLKPLTTVDCFESGLAPFPLGAVAAGSVTLVVKDDRVEIDGQAAFNTRAFSYFGQTLFPGPTIRVKAGSQCQVRLVNALSAAAQAACNDALAAHVASSEGTLICPDVTNLYAHGMFCGMVSLQCIVLYLKPFPPSSWNVVNACRCYLTFWFCPTVHNVFNC